MVDAHAVPVPRLANPGTADLLAEFDPELIESGRVNLIGLDLIRERLGERWPRRRDQVWAHADKVLDRYLEPSDSGRRVSEVEYALAFASLPPAVARGRCLRILDEILSHFLGEVGGDQLTLNTVVSIARGEIRCQPVQPEEVRALLSEPRPTSLPASARDDDADAAGTAWSSAAWPTRPVRLRSGQDLRLCVWTEPLHHVRRPDSVGLRFARDVTDARGRSLSASEREALTPLDAAELDLATLEQVREGMIDWGARAGLFVAPLSFSAAANAPARMRLRHLLDEVDEIDRERLILEVETVPSDVPSSRIVETVGLLQRFVRGVVVRTAPVRSALERLRPAPLLGVAPDEAALAGRPGEVFGCLKLLADRARGIAPEVFVLGLPAPELSTLVAATTAGFFSVRPQPEPLRQTA